MNCRPDNLAWGTVIENNRDRIAHGTIPKGIGHYRAKLREWEVHEIRVYASAGVREVVLANAYGVSRSAVKHIKHNRSWSEQYDPEILEREYLPKERRLELRTQSGRSKGRQK